jgi:hypothetical protein
VQELHAEPEEFVDHVVGKGDHEGMSKAPPEAATIGLW